MAGGAVGGSIAASIVRFMTTMTRRMAAVMAGRHE